MPIRGKQSKTPPPREERPVVAITLGDVNGIGPELALALIADRRMTRLCTPVLFGPAKALHYYHGLLPDTEPLRYKQVDHPNDIQEDRVNFVECSPDFGKVEAGQPTEEAGTAAYQALDMAVRYLKQGAADALLTLPINKQTVQRPDFTFPGHTEYLAAQFDTRQYAMLMALEQLRVAVVTGHVPLAGVPAQISVEPIVEKLRVLHEALRIDFGVAKPKLAVLGLNPHAGDGGLLGSEDAEVILPAIEAAKEQGLFAFGPYPADGFFAMGEYKRFDCILAMYHDQGLIPFKTLTHGEGVNFTAGLPILRTSPDHGTAYRLAGKGQADATSTRNALYMAIDTWRTRKLNRALLENALGQVQLPAHLTADFDEPPPPEDDEPHTATA